MMGSQEMKGLELARRFFNEWGLPYLRANFAQVSERAACFLCGGSQSLENDDELSQDHGWGPQFSIVLTSPDMRRYGGRLRRQINEATPKEWLGYRFRWPDHSIEVDSLDRWFLKTTKFTHPPETDKGWGRTHEANLYMLRHATVFHDPLGEFSARKEAFGHYPRSIWLRRVTGETFYVWHYGQYNFLDRLRHRTDPIAISVCMGLFMHATMRLCLILHDGFTPYWKWVPAEFRKLPEVTELSAWLTQLAETKDLEEQVRLVKEICSDIYFRLVAKNLVSPTPKGHPHPLMCAKMELEKL